MIVTCTSHKGGVGKTVSAVHLAAFFAREFGEGSTVLVDADPNGSAIEWAERGKENGIGLPFPVVGPEEDSGAEEHAIYDSQGRPDERALEAAVDESHLLVIPTTPEPLALNATMLLIDDLRRLGPRAHYRVLLTMVPWWNLAGQRARRALEADGIPLFRAEVRRREAFQEASLAGVPVYDVKKPRAIQGWEDYERTGREVIGRP